MFVPTIMLLLRSVQRLKALQRAALQAMLHASVRFWQCDRTLLVWQIGQTGRHMCFHVQPAVQLISGPENPEYEGAENASLELDGRISNVRGSLQHTRL